MVLAPWTFKVLFQTVSVSNANLLHAEWLECGLLEISFYDIRKVEFGDQFIC